MGNDLNPLPVVRTGTIVDELMEGLEAGVVTNFYGPAGSGKTNICMSISSSLMKQGKVAYIDTESGFSIRRFRQIHNGSMDNLLLFEPSTWEEQAVLLEKLGEIKPLLVVVDSVVSLFRLEDVSTEMNKELARFYRDLTKIARDLEIPAVVTTQSYSWDGKTGMVAKSISEYWSKAVVYIEKLERSNHRVMTLKKHRWLPEGREVEFEITAEGLKKSKRFGFI